MRKLEKNIKFKGPQKGKILKKLMCLTWKSFCITTKKITFNFSVILVQ